jgi:hypothetical protein
MRPCLLRFTTSTFASAHTSTGKPDNSRATADTCGMHGPPTGIGTPLISAMLVLSMLAMVSCTAIPASKQQRLAKANMLFDDTNTFAFSARLQPQSEPGTSATGAAQGGGCTACK